MEVRGRRVYIEDEEFGEDAILETLFIGCDTEGTGLVKVSKLIEYLSLTATGDNVDFDGTFKYLSMLLDPETKDVAIDIKAYRKGMRDWIDRIRCENSSEIRTVNPNLALYNDYQDLPEESFEMSRDENEGSPSKNDSSESVEGVGGESPQKQDWELLAKIEDLQLNNKRLTEHNSELSFQMENTEEANSQLLQELEELQKLLRSSQCLDEKNKALEKENEELQLTVSELQETSKIFQNKAKQLEKEKMSLIVSQEELKTKLASVDRTLENLSIDHKSVCLAYNEEKQKLVELEELQEEKSNAKIPPDTQEYLSNVIAGLTAEKEALQMSRNKMEAELIKVREELHQLTSYSGSAVTLGPPSFYATPVGKPIIANSLQQEIQEMSFDDYLPSPLVGCSKHAMMNASFESDNVFESSLRNANLISFTSLNISRTSSSNSATSDDVSGTSTHVAVDFSDKKNKALQTISELLRLDKTRETKEIRECLQNDLEKEMEFFAEKLNLLSRSQKASEKRVLTLLDSVGNLKDENKLLIEERSKVVKKLDSLSLSTARPENENLETRVENVISEFQTNLNRFKVLEKRCVELQNEVNATKTELESVKSENQTLVSSLDVEKNNRRESEHKLQEMEKLRDGLMKNHGGTVDKMAVLEREVEQTKSELALERKRSFGLEESLSLSVSKHEDELHDILEEIPDISYDGKKSENVKLRSKPPEITAFQVRTRLRALLANKHLTVRVSPDGKPTTKDDEAPLYISTPTDKYFQSKKSPPDPYADTSLKNNPRSSPPILTKRNKWNASHDPSWSSAGSSIVSPNLIAPFQPHDEFSVSPSYVNPFGETSRAQATKKPGNLTGYEGHPGRTSGQDNSPSKKRSPAEKSKLSEFSASLNSNQHCLNDTFSTKQPFRSTDQQGSQKNPQTLQPNDGAFLRRKSPLSSRLRSPSPRKDFTATPVTESTVISSNDDESTGKNSVQKNRSADNNENGINQITGNSSKETNSQDNANNNLTFDKLDVEHCVSGLNSPRAGAHHVGSGECSSGNTNAHGFTPIDENSYLEGLSFNPNLPSDEKKLEILFRSVSKGFLKDKRTLLHRLESKEQDCDNAKMNVTEGFQSLSSGIQDLKKTSVSKNRKQILKDSLDSLCQQISLLKQSSEEVLSKSRQLGCVQQEARMMTGVDVLISYGEDISRRLETLTGNVGNNQEQSSYSNTSATEIEPGVAEKTDKVTESFFQNTTLDKFVSPNIDGDNFSFLGTDDASRIIEISSDESEYVNEHPSCPNAAENIEEVDHKNKEKKDFTSKRKFVKQRHPVKTCLLWSLKLVVLFVLLVVFISFGIRYSVIDRDFVVHQLQRNLKRFEVKHFGQQPAF